MSRSMSVGFWAVLLAVTTCGCAQDGGTPTARVTSSNDTSSADPGRIVKIAPGPNVQDETQLALIQAKPGDTIEFGEGKFDFTMGLSLTVANIKMKGQGQEKTILSFKKQDAGKEGLIVNRDKFTIEDLTVEDTKGDAIKVNGAADVTFRRVVTQWTGGAKESNGAYGLYPVQCKNVLIEECVAIGASDAGIYVGQSQNVIVRKCRAEKNVAGIEIENCTDADVYDNVATNNAGGLLVFDLPGLQAKNGKRVRVYHNQVIANNHPNFAPKGNMVASVAPGTGTMIMATDQVELFQNTITDNQTFGLLIVSYLITGRPMEDKEYDPFPEGVYVHDNSFKGSGVHPAGDRGQMLAALLGTPFPDITYDGVHNPKKMINGQPPAGMGVYLKNNVKSNGKGDASFANLHWDSLDLKDLALSKTKIERNLKPYEGELAALPQVQWPGAR